jgi:hypothetical protein
MWTLFLAQAAHAAPREQKLVWDLSVKGTPVGKRNLTIRYLESDSGGTLRMLESYTEINGTLGPMKVRWVQRMTASIDPREPAAFTSVVDQNGTVLQVQGRWTPANWVVISSTSAGHPRETAMPLSRIDLSTADLMDPYSRLPLSYFDQARILSAETGEVLVGPIEKLGVSELTVAGQPIQVTGYAWTSSEGRSEFYYSTDGFLVKYQTQLVGIELAAVLHDPPPGGVDDFPVAAGRPKIEALDL